MAAPPGPADAAPEAAAQAAGARITNFTPQGVVAEARHVLVTFASPAVALGGGQSHAPVRLQCEGSEPEGKSRWLDERRWRFDFTRMPSPGTYCEAQVNPEFADPAGRPAVLDLAGGGAAAPSGPSFRIAGASVRRISPYAYEGAQIDEDQVFALYFNAPVPAQTVLKSSYCQAEGLGERIPLRAIEGEEREAVLRALDGDARDPEADAAVQLLQCARRLPASARLRLTVAAPAGAARLPAQHFDYRVREPFKATLACTRERAERPCLPVGDLRLNFTAPVPVALAREVRLDTPEGERLPTLARADHPEAEGSDVQWLIFEGPFPAAARLTLRLPADLKDDAGRALSNADQFPLAFPVADYPPLVKFASGTFGVIERHGHGAGPGDEAESPPLVPLTLRNVEAGLMTRALSLSRGEAQVHRVARDEDVLGWYARVRMLEDGRWTKRQLQAILAGQAPGDAGKGEALDSRSVSLLAGRKAAQTLTLPGAADQGERPFEVVGLPMPEPGFHVIEVASPRLGASLLEKPGPMYVRSAVLVTNLSVHLKHSREGGLVWVTALDDGRPVPDAAVSLRDCGGRLLAEGRSDEQGLWRFPAQDGASHYCEETGMSGLYASARIAADHPQAGGKEDFAFVLSGWDRGIESWRFNLPYGGGDRPAMVAHTVFDRDLLRAGETVSMKHFLREQTSAGPAVPAPERRPKRLLIEHAGSGEQVELPLEWRETPSGGLSAHTRHTLPEGARLGAYRVRYVDDDYTWYEPSQFRVESFKPPLLTGRLQVRLPDESALLVAPAAVMADVQVSYVAGGAAARLPVSLSAVARDYRPSFAGYDDYAFDPPREARAERGGEAGQDQAGQRLIVDKRPLVLDAQGSGRLMLEGLPVSAWPQQWRIEATYADPNGEIQTLSQQAPVWPAALQAGVKAPRWTRAGEAIRVEAVVLTPAGEPQAGVPVVVESQTRQRYSTRKRLVGGFYSYDEHERVGERGELCRGTTDDQGRLACEASLAESGEVEIFASVRDEAGRASVAAASLWVTGASDLWFGGENDDRIDLIASRQSYRVGETASLQVRMPFREATALVAVEREGILSTRVVQLSGENPTVDVAIEPGWGPNVYVSVLALRGRVRTVTWSDFFDGGWRNPLAWYRAYRAESEVDTTPTALVDLARPSFRYGVAELQVGDESDTLAVSVKPDRPVYQVRERAQLEIAVTLPDGQPAAHGSVALAAVDQALLELSPNDSWKLLEAMRQRHGYGVETATAQSEVVGRRHYGRKAVAAGGGGGKRPTRELLDTLLFWQPDLELDAQGKARVEIPLSDALTRFALVAVADHGATRFGTGRSELVITQDLQLIPALPLQVREGDRYRLQATVRNTTDRSMSVRVGASAPGQAELPAQEVTVAAGGSAAVDWPLEVPLLTGAGGAEQLSWRFTAAETGGPATDAVLASQTVAPAVPVRTRQATLLGLAAGEAPVALPVSAPPGALPGADGKPRGGLAIALRGSLAGGLPGVRAWLADYPYTCFEQLTSRAIGMRDLPQWEALMARLPAHLDDDGLLRYFPGNGPGSETLTAYVLAVAHEAQGLGMAFKLPADARDAMLDGLSAFAQGKLRRPGWPGQQDLALRRLQAIEALSRYGRAQARLLDTVAVAPQRWPSSAVIDWLSVLRRVPGIPQAAAHKAQARQVLLSRLGGGGTQLAFDGQAPGEPWWLMQSAETSLARLLIETVDDAAWRGEQSRLMAGLLAMQERGAWRTTTANLLGSLAAEKFSRRFESEPPRGQVELGLEGQGEARKLAWPPQGGQAPAIDLPWPAGQDALRLSHTGQGRVWATLQLRSAVAPEAPVEAGYRLSRRVEPVSQAREGQWTRGDVYRVVLSVEASSAAAWAVLSDPLPAGAVILGSGLGRDSAIAAAAGPQPEAGGVAPDFIERAADAYRAYFRYLPPGLHTVHYTVRLNTPGEFSLPPTRAEALYQPDLYGELPNAGPLRVAAQAEAP